MAYFAGNGGSFTVVNSAGLTLSVIVTTTLGAATTLYSDAARSASLGSSALTQTATSTTYYINDNNSYNISVKYNGYEMANTPDGVRVFNAFGDVFLGFSVSADDVFNQGALSPSGVALASMTPDEAVSNVSPLSTGVMYDVPVWIPKGFTVTNVGFVTGTTALTTPTNAWNALYTPDGLTLCGQSTASQSTIAANTNLVYALATPYVTLQAGFYRVAHMCQGTPSTLQGVTLNNVVMAAARGNMPRQGSTSGSALTTTAPATIATPSANAIKAYAYVS